MEERCNGDVIVDPLFLHRFEDLFADPYLPLDLVTGPPAALGNLEVDL